MQQPPAFARAERARPSTLFSSSPKAARPALRLSRDAACRVAHTGGPAPEAVAPPKRLEQLGLSVAQLLEQLPRLRDWETLLARFPGLEPDDVRDALDYAARRGLLGTTA